MASLGKDFYLTLEKGRVLSLNPLHLVGKGAFAIGCDRDRWVRSRHFFLCCDVMKHYSFWIPLFSHQNQNRFELPRTGRKGHRGWTEGSFYYHPSQIWVISHLVLGRLGADYSIMQGVLNTLDAEFVPNLRGEVHEKRAEKALEVPVVVEEHPTAA